MHPTACMSAMAAPAIIADASPTQGLPAYQVTDAAVNAPASIKPSSAMLMTPERSENIPPSAASISGVASLMAEKSSPALKMSLMLLAVSYQLNLRAPEKAEPVREPAYVDADGDEED